MAALSVSYFGSSPRAWGTPGRGQRHSRLERFIPTGVGNTTPRNTHRRPSPVHPHGRGEHFCACDWVSPSSGSSPRAWGTRTRRRGSPAPRRFIPTGVGNTRCCRPRICPRSVHPHGRGEHIDGRARVRGAGGSSPRAWGTPELLVVFVGQRRFIPTGVGNTATSAPAPSTTAVHPHGRGEHDADQGALEHFAGSSPRAWGTPILRSHTMDRVRFIPTGVGNTQMPYVQSRHRPVHPHGRGEHCAASPRATPAFGSSPRAWGTPHRGHGQGLRHRFIPTGVGNTGHRPGTSSPS